MTTENKVWECLVRAVNRFNKSSDRETLLCPRCEGSNTKSELAAAGERAIAHRLAFYLESELRRMSIISDVGHIVVDCEYNRHESEVKTLAGIAEERIRNIVYQARKNELEKNSDGFYVFSVYPDIVVHQRQEDSQNHLVVEIKKRSNRELNDYDALKLELFTNPKEESVGYGYKLGAWIVAEDELKTHDRKLQIISQYQNGRRKEVNLA
ncbi:MAG: hypothetical protein WAW39_17765 [Prosthecobacter sp.]|uniref:hypothetical protein n=1 Tax=Prosthecobacter sp. TaxID=1965333 RepID=UPI003BAFBB23